MPASPKPIRGTARRERAAGKRRQSQADRLVYAAVDARDGHRCRVCLEYCGVDIHRHHIVYRSQGGETSTANVCHLCQSCHEAVHARKLTISGSADKRLQLKAAVATLNGEALSWAIWEGLGGV